MRHSANIEMWARGAEQSFRKGDFQDGLRYLKEIEADISRAIKIAESHAGSSDQS